ncbi:MAG: nucleoside triphosphate pyrophosphohydrolase family protein [Terrimicrobiaceae bacterium]
MSSNVLIVDSGTQNAILLDRNIVDMDRLEFLDKLPDGTERYQHKIKKGETMNFEQYQNKSKQFAIYPDQGEREGLHYAVFGLASEVGEICSKIKKNMRDENGVLTMDDHENLGKELGDVLWYLSQCCEELGLDLQHVAEENVKKLMDRMERQMISGSGDDR